MNQTDLSIRVNALPGQYAGRLGQDGLGDLRDAARAGEWAEALEILIAGLDKTRTPITVTEYGDLSELAAAIGGLDALRIADLNIASE
jgi:hypothetical protein